MPLTIRDAAESDVPAIVEMIRLLAAYERLEDRVRATEERIRRALFGETRMAEALLADYETECVGFALFYGTYSTFAASPGIYLEDLYVKSHVRGKGVGTALLRRLAGIARERGCERLEWGVLDWNEPSIRFYQGLGAEPVEPWTRYRVDGKALDRLAALKPRAD